MDVNCDQIDADFLVNAFQNNEAFASQCYLNRQIRVCGTASHALLNWNGRTVVVLETKSGNDLICVMKESGFHPIEQDIVIINGICSGYPSDFIIDQGVVE